MKNKKLKYIKFIKAEFKLIICRQNDCVYLKIPKILQIKYLKLINELSKSLDTGLIYKNCFFLYSSNKELENEKKLDTFIVD